MKLFISDDIVQQTTMCKKHFVCLTGEKADLCEVKYCISDTSYFVKTDRSKICNYKVPYGSGFLCGCPTRKELYKRFKI
jgi:hypothetical protein